MIVIKPLVAQGVIVMQNFPRKQSQLFILSDGDEIKMNCKRMRKNNLSRKVLKGKE